jgi:hypothetical protein
MMVEYMNKRCMPGKTSHQQGYILLIVIIFLAILLSAGAHFFLRSTEHTKESGGIRDMTESVLLAESAMNYAMGQYMSGTIDDSAEKIPNFMDSQADLASILTATGSLFYITDTSTADEIEQTAPSLLQIVANGEASNVAATNLTSARLETSAVNPLVTLRINDLFDGAATFRPLLYTINSATGLLTPSMAVSWSSLDATVKAAVWFEVIQNPNNSSSVDVYVQAVAEVDGAKSYIQRTLVGYDPTWELGDDISAVSESSTPAETGGISRLSGN